MLSDQDFKALFHMCENDIKKIKLCIRFGRVKIIKRKNKNLPSAYLLPILALPNNHPIKKSKRYSGGIGSSQVIELKYSSVLRGIAFKVYCKCYFSHNSNCVVELVVQSLRNDSIQ